MNVQNRLKKFIFKQEFFSVIIGLILSLGMIGFAPSSILLGFFVVTALVYFFLKSKKLEFEPGLILPILLYGLFIISCFWTHNLELTLKGLGRTVSLAIVPLSFMMIPKFNKKNIDLIFNIFTKSNLIFAFFFLIISASKYLEHHDSTVFIYHNLVSVLGLNAIYVSVFYLISFFYILEKKNKSNFDIFTATVFLGMILLLSSKTIIVCLLLLSIIYGGIIKTSKRIKRRNKIMILIFAIVFAVCSKYVIERFSNEMDSNLTEVLKIEKVNHIYPWTGTTIRLLQLRFLKEQINENRILWQGFGLFASRESLEEKHLKMGTYPSYHEYNYHNMYAQMLSELGIIGLILLVVIIIFNLYRSIKKRSFLFMSFSVIIGIWFISESALWVQKGLFFFIIIQSLLHKFTFDSKEI